MEMTANIEYNVRVLDQEIDTLEICPSCSEYFVIGTYSLVEPYETVSTEPEEGDSGVSSSAAASRVGTIRILPVDVENQNILADQHQAGILRVDLPCAVLDLRFSPTDPTLLCVSTSIGELRFYRITYVQDETGADSVPSRITSLGIVKLYENAEGEAGGATPLITQFAWAGNLPTAGHTRNLEASAVHLLAICDTSGQTALVQVAVPEKNVYTSLTTRFEADHELQFESYGVHKHLHDLEAWTISTLTLSRTPHDLRQILLSGGDDSALIVSTYHLDMMRSENSTAVFSKGFHFETLPLRFWLDTRTHGAGVVSILPLHSVQAEPHREIVPILTGSYDQHLRLLLFDPETFKFTHITELELEGGVWRIALLDQYRADSQEDGTVEDYILLISAMHAGCYIVRLSRHQRTNDDLADWKWEIEAQFKEPHESMVYACAANVASGENHRGKQWRVISTSFYDKKICTWLWTDIGKLSLGQQNAEMQI